MSEFIEERSHIKIKIIAATMQVIKKDGSKQDFDQGKIRNAISMAAQEAGIGEDKKNEIIEKVLSAVSGIMEGKEEITTTEIKTKVLMELDNIEPSVSDAWRKYDREKKGAQG